MGSGNTLILKSRSCFYLSLLFAGFIGFVTHETQCICWKNETETYRMVPCMLKQRRRGAALVGSLIQNSTVVCVGVES